MDSDRSSVPEPSTPNGGGGSAGQYGGGWKGAAGLLVVCAAVAVIRPSLLVGIPLVVLVLALPAPRLGVLVAGAAAAFLGFAGGPREGLWWVDRGWAIVLGGWFAALTMAWPGWGFTPRALGAVAGTVAMAAAYFVAAPGHWETLDWLVGDRLRQGVAAALETFRLLGGDDAGTVPAELTETLYATGEFQAMAFPALLAVGSLAGLGVAWWLYVRLAFGSNRGLGPMQEFRFNDQLVWLLVAGLVLLVLQPGGAWTRVGSNAVVFMGALYALRGAAVVVFLNGGVSFFGYVVVALGVLFVAPVMLAGAVLIGLGDTWLDLRERVRRLTA